MAFTVLAGCAAQGPPGGGPVDRTGPTLVSCYPENNATGVDGHTKIVLHFSEPIDARSLEGVLQVTPRLSRTPLVKVQRRKVTVRMSEPLQSDRTYIFNFGRNLKDYQNNPAAQEIKLAFATGDSIDQGTISGRVSDFPANAKTVVWFFKKETSFPDTLWLAEPDFIVSVDKDGNYQATNLSVGEYRTLAVSGERPRPKFLTENDLLAPSQMESLTIKNRHDHLENINFRLSRRYLKPFRLLTANPLDGYLELNFSRPLTDDKLTSENFTFSDNIINVRQAWVSEEQSSRIILLADSLRLKTDYQITASGIRDENADALIIGGRTARFTWLARPDTLQPKIATTSPAANAKNIEVSALVRVNLSEPVIGDTLAQNVELLSRDTLKVPVRSGWLDANSFSIEPEQPLLSATNYTLRIHCRYWQDYAGNRFQDSLVVLRFSTLDQNLFGNVSGKIVPAKGNDLKNLVIEASLAGEQKFQRQTRPDSTGFYFFNDLLPGKYTFSIWEDRNKDGRYDFGRMLPYFAAEPYRIYLEQINVRSRWETAEVNWNY